MTFLYDNLDWMLFNLVLALVPVLLVFFLRKKFHPLVRYGLFLLWFLFLPNTIYLVTDIEYLPYQVFRSTTFEQALLFIEYGILVSFGIFSYLYSLEPVELMFRKLKIKRRNIDFIYVVIHIAVAFGIVMGKVQRTHSWYVFTEPQRVVNDIRATLSASDLLFWVFFCAVAINASFFVFRRYFPALAKKRKK